MEWRREGQHSAGNIDRVGPKNVTEMYILEPGHGFQYQLNDTIKGYVNGFCSVSGGRTDSDYASFECAKGPDSASFSKLL